jgi:hypothetical protein
VSFPASPPCVLSNRLQICPYFIHSSVIVPSSLSMLQVQEVAMALLALRLVLLCQHSKLCVPMDPPTLAFPLRCMLLSQSWVRCGCYYHLEDRPSLPRRRQGDNPIHAHIPCTHIHSNSVRPTSLLFDSSDLFWSGTSTLTLRSGSLH